MLANTRALQPAHDARILRCEHESRADIREERQHIGGGAAGEQGREARAPRVPGAVDHASRERRVGGTAEQDHRPSPRPQPPPGGERRQRGDEVAERAGVVDEAGHGNAMVAQVGAFCYTLRGTTPLRRPSWQTPSASARSSSSTAAAPR